MLRELVDEFEANPNQRVLKRLLRALAEAVEGKSGAGENPKPETRNPKQKG